MWRLLATFGERTQQFTSRWNALLDQDQEGDRRFIAQVDRLCGGPDLSESPTEEWPLCGSPDLRSPRLRCIDWCTSYHRHRLISSSSRPRLCAGEGEPCLQVRVQRGRVDTSLIHL